LLLAYQGFDRTVATVYDLPGSLHRRSLHCTRRGLPVLNCPFLIFSASSIPRSL
jgi:hypothetical protein